MSKSMRDTQKQLYKRYVKHLDEAGMAVTAMLLNYDGYPDYQKMCNWHKEAVAKLHDIALEMGRKI